MLETIDLTQSLPEGVYQRRLRAVRRRLLDLQRTCWNADLGSLLVFEGWAFSGRGSTIAKLTQRLEPRGFVMHFVRSPRTHEQGLPWMHRFWVGIPRFGQMGIYHGSWYRPLIVGRSVAKMSSEESDRIYRDIESFERMLTDDGYVMAKFFLHIDLHQQSERMAAAQEDPLHEWKLEEDEWDHRVLHPRNLAFVEEILARTSFEGSPWYVIGANDRYWTTISVLEQVAAALEAGLLRHGIELEEADDE